MGFIDVVFSFCTFWTGIHAFKYLLSRLHLAHSSRQLTRSRAVLPLDRNSSSGFLSFAHYVGNKISRAMLSLQLDVTLSTMSIRIETTALNSTFDKASVELAHAAPRSYASRVKSFLEKFYSLGVGFGLLGMALGYLLLLWSCLTVFQGSGKALDTTKNVAHPAHDESEPLSSSEGSSMGSTGLAVQPIVSGR